MRVMQVDDTPAVRALVAALQRICAELPGAEQYVMVHHPAFRVGKKPFAIAGMEQAKKGATVSVNLGRDAQPGLLDDARFWRTPYIGQHGWVTVVAARLEPGELSALVGESWQRVAGAKLLAARGAGTRPAMPAARATPKAVAGARATRKRSRKPAPPEPQPVERKRAVRAPARPPR